MSQVALDNQKVATEGYQVSLGMSQVALENQKVAIANHETTHLSLSVYLNPKCRLLLLKIYIDQSNLAARRHCSRAFLHTERDTTFRQDSTILCNMRYRPYHPCSDICACNRHGSSGRLGTATYCLGGKHVAH